MNAFPGVGRLTFLLGLAAATFVPAAAGAQSALDACGVLTADDVSEVVGSPPRKAKPAQPTKTLPGSRLSGSTCDYRGDGWRIRFFVERGHDAESKKITRMTFKNWRPVSGLGDEAYWGQQDPAKPGTMTVVRGADVLVLNWFIPGETAGPGTLENSTELMRRALGRLE
jgi:hypothetical protein